MLICPSFGYNEYQSLLLQLPGCAVAFISVWLATWWAGKYNARGLAIIALVIPTLIGGALMAWLPADNKAGLLAGNFLTNTVGSSKLTTPVPPTITLTFVALPLLYSWVTANCKSETSRRNCILIQLCSRRPYEENYGERHYPNVFLCWEHHWPSHFPSQRRTSIYPRQDDYCHSLIFLDAYNARSDVLEFERKQKERPTRSC